MILETLLMWTADVGFTYYEKLSGRGLQRPGPHVTEINLEWMIFLNKINPKTQC
jgi:hypothetical protein